MTDFSATDLTGEMLLERYRLGRRIGGGGMAEVYEAEDALTGRSVAVKIALPYLAGDPTFGVRLRHEAEIIADLDHPGIARLYDTGEEGGRLFLVMELVRGPDLRLALEQSGPMPLGRTLKIVADVLAALQHAHERGVLHRDIKPENVLLSPEGRAKLVDFGIARARAEISVTSPGFVVGSPHYLAPERLTGSPASVASDVYSVGVLLFRMLTGHLPFEGDTPDVVHAQQILWKPRAVSGLRPGLPSWVDDIVRQALDPQPDSRYGSAEEMRREILRMGAAVDGEATVRLAAVPVDAEHRPSGDPAASRGHQLPRLVYLLLAAFSVLTAILLLGASTRDGIPRAASPSMAAPLSEPTPAFGSTAEPTLPTATPVSPTSTPAPEPVATGESAGAGVAPPPQSVAPSGGNHPQGGPPGLRNKPDKNDKKKRN